MITFRKAVREKVTLIISLSGGTGSGKTMSAMRMASGIANGKTFAVIDTENGRASHYADTFSFDVAELHAPFWPPAYTEAIVAADKAGYAVIVVDSMSHVWAGDGGVIDMQENELDRMAGTDYKKREACKMAAWIKPKLAHKHMMQKFLQLKAHLILCFRAEEKIEMVKGADGHLEVKKKTTLIGKDGWVPICEKNVPFEATCSFLLLASAPGIGHPIKLQEQHKQYFNLAQPLDESAGHGLARWAAGEAAISGAAAQSSGDGVSGPPGSHASAPPDDALATIDWKATVDWKAALEADTTEDDLGRTWERIVKDGTITGQARASLYKHYQARVKAVKAAA